MPKIDRARLSAKLDTIPEHDREPYLAALKANGYTWDVDAPDPNSVSVLGQLKAAASEEANALPFQHGRGAAKALGILGKAATDPFADVPVIGPAAKFLVPQNAQEVGMMALGAPIGAAVGFAGGKLLESKAGKYGVELGAKFGNTLSEGAKNLLRYAESKGLSLSAADLTESKAISTLESMLEKTPFGSGPIKRFRDSQIAAIRKLRDNLADRFGTSEDASVLTEIAKNAIKEHSQAMKAEADTLYGKIGELSQGQKIPLKQTASAAADLLEQQLKLRPELRNQRIVQMASDVLGVEPDQITSPRTLQFVKDSAAQFADDYSNWNGLRRKLGGIIEGDDATRALGQPGMKFLGSEEAGAAKKLYKAAELDLSDFAKQSGGELKQAHDVASAFYKEGRAVFDNKTIKGLLKTQPEKVVDVVFRPGAVTPIRAVKAAAGDAFPALKKQFVAKVLPEVGDTFTPAAFQNALDKYGDATLREIFEPKELMQFKALAKLSSKIMTAERLAGNPSGTARTVISGLSFGSAGGLIVSNPIVGVPYTAGVVIGPKALAELYTSQKGRELLLKGFTVGVNAPEAGKIGGAILGYLSAKTSGERERNP